jgi:hypothetical protein
VRYFVDPEDRSGKNITFHSYELGYFQMSTADAAMLDATWRKSQRSVNNGACVEVASGRATVLVRDSVNPGGGTIQYSARTWRGFLADAKTGGYDVSR